MIDRSNSGDEGAACEQDGYEKAELSCNRSAENAADLARAAARVAGPCSAIDFGAKSTTQFAEAREVQLANLQLERVLARPSLPPAFIGGEHEVFVEDEPVAVIKQTLPGYYGRVLDEMRLFDSRTFRNVFRLSMRSALPSEYLLRWALMSDIFGVPTEYLGCVEHLSGERQMVVSQPYVEQDDADPPTLVDIEVLMRQFGFVRVSSDLISNPEIEGVTWYRESDGVLVTDAHPRNFRKDLNGYIIPIDLVLSVNQGRATLLTHPARVWLPPV